LEPEVGKGSGGVVRTAEGKGMLIGLVSYRDEMEGGDDLLSRRDGRRIAAV